jgi:hypothetical protein
LQKQGDKLIKPGALKTIGDVLDTMRDQNWRNLMDDRKSNVSSKCIVVLNADQMSLRSKSSSDVHNYSTTTRKTALGTNMLLKHFYWQKRKQIS